MLTAVLCNQKGGVGKTTTAVNLARAAHLRGLRTLIVDMDPQAATTMTVLGRMPEPGVLSVADLLSDRTRRDTGAAEVVCETGWAKVDCLPSGGDVLAMVQTELVTAGPGREHRLREALGSLDGYDLVLIDSPPQLDLLLVNSLAAASRGVIVSTAGLFSLNSIALLLRTVDEVRRYIQPELRIVGIILNAFEAATVREKHWLAELRRSAPVPLWEPPIPRATWIAQAIEAGLGLDELGSEYTARARERAGEVAAAYGEHLSRLLDSGSAAVPQGGVS